MGAWGGHPGTDRNVAAYDCFGSGPTHERLAVRLVLDPRHHFFLALCRGPSLARPKDDNAEVGHGLVCDTAKQLERFVVLLN